MIVDEENICGNCGNTTKGKFCHTCGQKSGIKRLSMKELFSIIPSAVFTFEKRYWNTIKDFLQNPSKMIKGYSVGKRKYYASPIQFFYFFATIQVIIIALTSAEDVDGLESESYTKAYTNLERGFLVRMDWVNDFIDNILTNHIKLFELGIPFVFGFLMFFFYRNIFNLAESFAFSFLLWAFAIEIVPIISYIIPFFSEEFEEITEYIIIATSIIYIFYKIGKRKFLNIFLGIILSTLSIIFYLLFLLMIGFLLYPILK